MFMCKGVSYAVGRGRLLWTGCSLDKTLLAFALHHFFYSKAKLTYYSRYLLISYFCIPISYHVKEIIFVRRCGLSGGSAGKESAWNEGDLDFIPGLRISPGEGNSYPLLYSDLENSMNYGVTKSWTWLSNFYTHTHTHTHMKCHTIWSIVDIHRTGQFQLIQH